MDKNTLSTSLTLTQIDVKDLEIGMYVSKLDRPWLESTFLFQGFEIQSIRDIKEVQKQCNYVYIDTEQQAKSHHSYNSPASTSSTDAIDPPKKRASSNKIASENNSPEKILPKRTSPNKTSSGTGGTKKTISEKTSPNMPPTEKISPERTSPNKAVSEQHAAAKLPKKKSASEKPSSFEEWLERRSVPEPESNFEKEIATAANVFKTSSNLVKSFMEDVAFGRPINIEMAKQTVSQCVQSVINAPDALMWLTQLKNRDEYTSQHSMNVCIYSIALGRQINFPPVELEKVGLCGLMHDMGKLKIPLEILNKPGRFEPAEWAVMQSHPALGMQLLLSDKAIPGCVIDAVYGHHERLDGKGYPRGLTEERIHPYTRIVTIADMYDAIASDRVYKNGKTHLEAINIMTKMSGTQLDTGLVIKFIECLGIYPPGNIVEMTNGEVAVVIEVNKAKKLKPKITMLLDEEKKVVKPRLVDLSKIDLDASGNVYAIKRMVRTEEYNININQLYKMGLLQLGLKIA